MKNSPLFTQIVQSLEYNENSERIKKLIFYVAKRIWAKDREQLDSVSLIELLQELYASHADIESLRKSFYQMSRTLNKPEQYLSIATTIIAELEIFYDLPKVSINDDRDLITTPLAIPICQEEIADSDLILPATPIIQNKKKIEPFELRFKVMIQANPLQTKILLFSALEHQFDWSQPDWAALRSTELYELIRNITYTCQSFEVLNGTLNSTARKLNHPDEYGAIAQVITQALKPIYA